MAINQGQVDHIISSASAEDPEIQLLKLKDEVELLKTSIKRLLIDIRERMNDTENPLIYALQGKSTSVSQPVPPAPVPEPEPVVKTPEPEPLPASEEIPEMVPEVRQEPRDRIPAPRISRQDQDAVSDADLFEALKAHLGAPPLQPVVPEPTVKEPPHGKVKLQNVFMLFEWASKTVKRYGHDRIDLMLESYQEMGYLSEKAMKQVRDVTRLMPPSIGEQHEISAEEFVSALYELNNILNPTDSSLDRDMIEVLMERKQLANGSNKSRREGSSVDTGFPFVKTRE